jgi:hydroxymethylglutaryl-CoA synthase
LYAQVREKGAAVSDPYQATSAVAAVLRKKAGFRKLLDQKMSLGASLVRDFGNLYSAALPSWVAAGFEEAAKRGLDLVNHPMVMVGYGSGDAAESLPIRAVPGWEQCAKQIGIARSVGDYIDLTRAQYEALHDGRDVSDIQYEPTEEFVITHVGEKYDPAFQDLGVEYYKYVG